MVADLRDLRDELPLAWRIARMRLRAQAHYRRSFALQIVSNLLVTVLEIVALVIFFQRFPALGGWTLNEVLFLYAVTNIAFETADTIQNGLDFVPEHIRTGEFDRLLTRPMSVYLQALVLEVSLRHIGRLLLSAGLFAWAWARLEPAATAAEIALLALGLLCATALFVAIFSLGSIISFWTVGSIEMVNAISYGGSDLAQYPIHIYGRAFRFVFTWLLPLGLVIYYPTLILLDKPDPLGLAGAAPVLGPLLTLAFVLAVGWLWRLGVRRYHSTGS